MSTRGKYLLSFGIALLLAFVALTPVTPAASAQSNAAASRLRFAAASLRAGGRMADGAEVDKLKCRGVDGELLRGRVEPEFTVRPPGWADPRPARQGRCTGNNVLLTEMLLMAYGSAPFVDLIGFPLDRLMSYQIESVAEDPSRVTTAELKQMLQALLEDRFKARVHREMREADGYVLTVAKGGIKFKETSAPADHPTAGSASIESLRRTDGILPMLLKGNFTMGTFAYFFLSPPWGRLDRRVVDKTNLPGVYDITLKYDLITEPSARGGPGGRSPQDYNPPLPKALEDQLGLHLERSKVQYEVLVVDHLERATEN